MTVTRRTAFAASAAAATLAAPAVHASTQGRNRKTYVLVHGTYLGGWIWTPVADRLQAMGHRVYHPSMTGCGERKHLMSPSVGLDTHATDVTNLITWEELDPVILLGHSFAGNTVSEVAGRMPERIRNLVFFDALIPTRERPAAIMPNPDGTWPQSWIDRTTKFIDGYQMVFWDSYPVDMLIPPSETAIVDLLKRRITPFPAKQWTDRVDFSKGAWEAVPRCTYLQPTEQKHSPSSERMWGPAKGPGWDFAQLPIPRLGMLSRPDLVADWLATLS